MIVGTGGTEGGFIMNLLHLEYFRELAYHEHVQETAKKLHVSAPTISTSLRNLEEELGVTLFDRVGRNMYLNDCGKAFLPYVEQMFDVLTQGIDAVDAVRLRLQNRVSFSVKDAAFWSHVIEMFNKRYPEIYIHQHDIDPEFDGKLIDQLGLDFMVTDKELINNTLDSCVLYQDQFVLMVSKDHPLAQRNQQSCSLFDLQGETFLFRPKSDYFQQSTDKLFAQYGFTPSKSMEFEYVLRSMMLEKNVGVIVTAERTIQSEFYNHVSVLRIREFKGVTFSKRLYWKKDKKLSPAAEAFQAYIIRVSASTEAIREEIKKLRELSE